MKKNILAALFFSILLLGTACAPSKQASNTKATPLDLSTEERSLQLRSARAFLDAAVLSGLTQDGFPPGLADSLLGEASNWVRKCPICDGVRSGMSRYLREIGNASPKSALSPAAAEILEKGAEKERKEALKILIDRYVQSYMFALKLSPEEAAELQTKLKAGRKQGMAAAPGGEGFFCASCDGACHIEVGK